MTGEAFARKPISVLHFSEQADSKRLTDAIGRAARWLIARQNADGSWHDFWLPGGTSDEWVTSYTGSALASVPVDVARGAARLAWEFLEAGPPSRVAFGYSRETPCDADSTAWALHLAESLDTDRSALALRARQFLQEGVSRGGVATYHDDAAIRAFTHVPPATSFAGWLQPHWCVAGAVAGISAIATTGLREAIVRAQSDDGSWPSYWWRCREYATAMCARALTGPQGQGARERAAAWASRHDDRPANAFVNGLRLSIAISGNDARGVQRFTQAVLREQLEDGSWPAGAWLRVPAPDVIDPSGLRFYCWMGIPKEPGGIAACGFESIDFTRTFTTATVLRALVEVRRSVT